MSAPEHSPPRSIRRVLLLLASGVLLGLALAAVAMAVSGSGGGQSAQDDDPHSPGHTSPHDAAAMVGHDVPAPGGPTDLDSVAYPPPVSTPADKGVREYRITAQDEEIEVADGVKFAAWTFNGTVPGPVLRATEGETIRIRFTNAGSEPHTMHLHGIHPANQDGVFEVVDPGETFVYEFPALPAGMHVYHCHAAPLKKHIHKGLYGAFIIDPPKPRPPAREMSMLMNGFDTDGDGGNNVYTVNGKAFFYSKYPVKVKRNELLRIYLSNMTEFDLVNSFHLHGNFFNWQKTGNGPWEFTDTVTLGQGERGVIEVRFPHPGKYMFHAHQSEFADLGWMGFFEVVE